MTETPNDSREELKAFRKLMVALSHEGIKDWHDRAQYIMSVTNVSWFSSNKELEQILKAAKGNFDDRVLPLRPPTGLNNEKTIVGMWCSWDFESEIPCCKIEILIRRAKGHVYGFRVDPPDFRDKHCFWHVQFTHCFLETEARFPKSKATWIDESTPAFPIPLGDTASITPKDATVYAVISLYGADIRAPIYDRIRQLTAGVHGSLKELLPSPSQAN